MTISRVIVFSLFFILVTPSPYESFALAVSASHSKQQTKPEENHIKKSKKSATSNDLIKITSDDLIIDDQTLSASFKGSVTVYFEDMVLKTDELKIHYVNNKGRKAINKIEIPGKLKAMKTTCQEVIVADRGEYSALLNELVLNGNVRMEKDNNILITDKMIYITKLKSMSKNPDEN